MKSESWAFHRVETSAVAAVIVGVLAACCAGCGSTDKATFSSTGTIATTQIQASPTTTKPQASELIGNTHMPYVVRMKAIEESFEEAVRALYPLDTGSSGSPERSTTMTRLESARQTITDVEESLRQVTPPARVNALQARLSKAVSEVGTEVDEMIAALQQDDLAKFIAVSGLPDLATVNATTKLIKKAGYDIVAK